MSLRALLFLFVAIASVNAVNYTCQSLAYIKNSVEASCLGTCIGTAPTSKSVKLCKKTCKPPPAFKVIKKLVTNYLRCLSLYWKGVETVVKKLQNTTASATFTRQVIRCLRNTSSMSSCRIHTFTIPNSKLKLQATKFDSKWASKKCLGTLTPSNTTCPNPTPTTVTTTVGPTQAATTAGGATTATTAATTPSGASTSTASTTSSGSG